MQAFLQRNVFHDSAVDPHANQSFILKRFNMDIRSIGAVRPVNQTVQQIDDRRIIVIIFADLQLLQPLLFPDAFVCDPGRLLGPDFRVVVMDCPK